VDYISMFGAFGLNPRPIAASTWNCHGHADQKRWPRLFLFFI